MRPSGRQCVCASLAVLVCLALASRTNADNLTITSSPPGASVEINGKLAGDTPTRPTIRVDIFTSLTLFLAHGWTMR